jgi:two-component system chemotaxis response regulator CheY
VWRVLLVDDSALSRNAIQAALEPYGLELGHAENGQVAIDKAMSSVWDLIFLDVIMPIMDGPTALREIRKRGNTTQVVLTTSVSTATVVASAIKLGNVHYIGKPFTPAQIRAVATKLLKLDPSTLTNPPRVLLQHSDPDLPARLRKILPSYVALDTTQALAQSLDVAEAQPHELVLVESKALADDMVPVANVLRRTARAAGIFAVSSDARSGSLWQPDEGLDGTLPSSLDDGVKGFLHSNFIRRLVSIEGRTARVAGFRGPPADLPAFTAMVVRVLGEHWSKLDATTDLQIDLTRMPAELDMVIALITAVNDAFRELGAAASFRVVPALLAAVTEQLGQLVIAS